MEVGIIDINDARDKIKAIITSGSAKIGAFLELATMMMAKTDERQAKELLEQAKEVFIGDRRMNDLSLAGIAKVEMKVVGIEQADQTAQRINDKRLGYDTRIELVKMQMSIDMKEAKRFLLIIELDAKKIPKGCRKDWDAILPHVKNIKKIMNIKQLINDLPETANEEGG